MNERHIQMETTEDNQFPYEISQNAKQAKEKKIRYLIAWIKKLSVSLVENKTGKKVEWVSDKDMNANVGINAKVKTDLILSLRSGGRPHQNWTDARAHAEQQG